MNYGGSQWKLRAQVCATVINRSTLNCKLIQGWWTIRTSTARRASFKGHGYVWFRFRVQGVGAGIVIVLSCVAGRFLYVVCMFHECLVAYIQTHEKGFGSRTCLTISAGMWRRCRGVRGQTMREFMPQHGKRRHVGLKVAP